MNCQNITSYDQLPLTLSAEAVAEILGISRSGAYTLFHRQDFPTLKIGKRTIVPRDKLIQWMDQQVSI